MASNPFPFYIEHTYGGKGQNEMFVRRRLLNGMCISMRGAHLIAEDMLLQSALNMPCSQKAIAKG